MQATIQSPRVPPTTRLLGFLALWAGAVVCAAALGLPSAAPPNIWPILITLLAAGFTAMILVPGWPAEAVRSFGIRGILIFNSFRFVGAFFLLMASQGRLPSLFANRAGWGDIAAAAGAVLLLAIPGASSRRGLVLAWNAFGLMDLIVAVGTASWLSRVAPGTMAAIRTLPVVLIPLWAVPVLLAGHIAVFARSRLLQAGQDPNRS